MWQYQASAVRAVDGDTVEMHLDLGFYTHAQHHFRLFSYSAPERNQPGGTEATAKFTALLLDHAAHATNPKWPFVVRTDRDRQTFTRYLAVSITCGLGHELIGELMAWQSGGSP